ncbi:hypothetical protein BDV95DRAFT_605454 [Massariosphaeria phaeospora]|uniref:Uncharacterized protein n=1 Tax=Massariosphaeria phaeospora TaxID=100035 RepID=A0A7C8MML3_9PLEO|nr:hypothetical protein BDV95DRAFT_605454 [Massariosphaeria phaeospora]
MPQDASTNIQDKTTSAAKHPLQRPSTPMTSTSHADGPASRGDLSFAVGQTTRKVTQFNPLLTPSPLLDPKLLERKRKAAETR